MPLKLVKPKTVQTVAPLKIARPVYVHRPTKEATVELPAGRGIVKLTMTDAEFNHLHKVWDLRKGTLMVLVEANALKALLTDYKELIGTHGARVLQPEDDE